MISFTIDCFYGSPDIHTLHGGAQSGIAVQCKNASLGFAGAVGKAVASRQSPQERFDGLLRRDAQHRFDGPGHAQIGDVAGALGHHPLVGGGHVGMGAPHGADAAIQIVAQRQLLAGGLGVEVQQGKGSRLLRLVQLPQQLVRRGKGVGGLPVQSRSHRPISVMTAMRSLPQSYTPQPRPGIRPEKLAGRRM